MLTNLIVDYVISSLYTLFVLFFDVRSFHSTLFLRVNLNMWRSQGPNLKKASHISDITVSHTQVGVRYSHSENGWMHFSLELLVQSLYWLHGFRKRHNQGSQLTSVHQSYLGGERAESPSFLVVAVAIVTEQISLSPGSGCHLDLTEESC